MNNQNITDHLSNKQEESNSDLALERVRTRIPPDQSVFLVVSLGELRVVIDLTPQF
jgi:hypothetical protein